MATNVKPFWNEKIIGDLQEFQDEEMPNIDDLIEDNMSDNEQVMN